MQIFFMIRSDGERDIRLICGVSLHSTPSGGGREFDIQFLQGYVRPLALICAIEFMLSESFGSLLKF